MAQDPTGEQIMASFHQWLYGNYPRTRKLCYHIPNGGLRTGREAMALKAKGVTAGMPDYEVAIPANGYPSLRIEFKGKYEPLTDSQKEVIPVLRKAGHLVHICDDLQKAKDVLLNYLSTTDYLKPLPTPPQQTKLSL